jgi:hypothetical protein
LKTGSAIVFVHICWFQHLITHYVKIMRQYKTAEGGCTCTDHIDGGRRS